MVLFVSHQSSPLVHVPDGTTLHRRRNNKQRVTCAESFLTIISSQTNKRRIGWKEAKKNINLASFTLFFF